MLDYQFLKTNIFNLVNVDAQKVLNSIEHDEEAREEKGIPRKRKRLEDFTPQERMIRRKLKNRAAAQSARDRKKERMDQLEKVVGQLEVENKELKRSNEELRTNMHMLMTQNQELLEHLRKNENTTDTTTTTTTTTTATPRVPEFISDHTYYARVEEVKPEDEPPAVVPCTQVVVIPGDNQVVIKDEEETDAKHASLGISLPQKLQILLVSLITMWLTNPRLTDYLTSMSTSDQEKVLKQMILRKVEPKLKQKNSKAIQALLQTDLVPILEGYAKKRQMNYSSCVKKSKILLGKRTRVP